MTLVQKNGRIQIVSLRSVLSTRDMWQDPEITSTCFLASRELTPTLDKSPSQTVWGNTGDSLRTGLWYSARTGHGRVGGLFRRPTGHRLACALDCGGFLLTTDTFSGRWHGPVNWESRPSFYFFLCKSLIL